MSFDVHPWDTSEDDRSPFRDLVLDVAAAAAELLVASFALGVLAAGPLLAFGLVRRWLR